MNKLLAGASLLTILAAGGGVQAADAVDAGAVAAPTVGEVIVTGTRQAGITAANSAAPIQVVGVGALKRSGPADLSIALFNAVPSLNIQTTGADSAAVSIQAALRGLGPNDTLVLVDGKRRHTTSNLAVDGGTAYSGAFSADLGLIPIDAIDHVEVLTDSAASQYGSDAIGGVINIILKKSATAGSITGTLGQYYNSEGKTGDISINKGFALGDKGFINVTLENRYHGFSVQGIGDNRLTDSNGNLLPGLGSPNSNVAALKNFPYINQLNGDPELNLYNALYNMGYDLGGGAEFYSFGSFSSSVAQHFENDRTPSLVSGVTSLGETIFPFPYGFDPLEKFNQTDYSVTGGLKGVTEGWNWDFSSTYGGNHQDVYTINSANSSLYPILQAASATPIIPQTNFYDGAYNTTQWTNNLDFNRDFTIGLASPLNVAIGFEHRRETYSISPGEPASYFGTGAQSFIGYTPLDKTDVNRTNYAIYVDLAADLVKGLHTDLSGRWEHYSDFGTTWNGGLTARYDFNPVIAIRGTVATGFRAPTLGEEYYSGTNVSPSSIDVQLPPNSGSAIAAGIPALKPETSTNLSFGFVAHPISNLQITADAYQIQLDNRILVSGFIYGTNGVNGIYSLISQNVVDSITGRGVTFPPAPAFGQPVDPNELTYSAISVFANAANTRTRGIEMTASYASDFDEYGHVDWSVGLSYNHTAITAILPLPTGLQNQAQGQVTYLTATALTGITTAVPEEKVILQAYYTVSKFSLNLRETIYGGTSQFSANGTEFYQIGATGITDIDLGYKLTDYLKLDFGANNLFDVIPPTGDPAGGGHVFKVPYAFAPWGGNGGYYYARATVTF
jgi:iron complex outermembrane receptor protein